MTLSVEIVRLMILFVPGFIGIITLSNLTRYKEKPAHIFLIEPWSKDNNLLMDILYIARYLK